MYDTEDTFEELGTIPLTVEYRGLRDTITVSIDDEWDNHMDQRKEDLVTDAWVVGGATVCVAVILFFLALHFGGLLIGGAVLLILAVLEHTYVSDWVKQRFGWAEQWRDRKVIST